MRKNSFDVGYSLRSLVRVQICSVCALNVPYHHRHSMKCGSNNPIGSMHNDCFILQMKTGMNSNVRLNGRMVNESCNVLCLCLCLCVSCMNWNLNEESIKIKALIEWHRTDTVKLEIELTDNGRSNGDNRSHSAKNETAWVVGYGWLCFSFIYDYYCCYFAVGHFKIPRFPHTYARARSHVWANLSVCSAHRNMRD